MDAIDGSRYADRETLQTPSERPSIVRLDEQMQVIALHGVVSQPEAKSRARLCKTPAEPSKQSAAAQTRHARPHP